MNCEILQTLLDVPESEIPADTLLQMNAHLENCRSCDALWQRQHLLYRTFRSKPDPEFSSDTAERLLSHVFTTAAHRRRRRATVSLGLAAVLVLGIASGFLLGNRIARVPEYAMRDGTLILQSERPAKVRVAFNSGSKLDNVRFTIDLPAGMQVAGQPGQRHLSWVGELHKGRNLLELPLMAHAGTRGSITAQLSRGGQQRIFNVPVVAEKPAPFTSRLWNGLAESLNWSS